MIWCFIEGLDDKRFFEKIIQPSLEEKFCTEVYFWEYAQKKKEKVKDFIKSINAMNGKIIFIADKDEITIEQKRELILSEYSELEESELEVVVKEIESWYLAGLVETSDIKLSKSLPSNTDNISKEQFCMYFERLNCLEAKIFILENFDSNLACDKNSSFKDFIFKYIE